MVTGLSFPFDSNGSVFPRSFVHVFPFAVTVVPAPVLAYHPVSAPGCCLHRGRHYAELGLYARVSASLGVAQRTPEGSERPIGYASIAMVSEGVALLRPRAPPLSHSSDCYQTNPLVPPDPPMRV